MDPGCRCILLVECLLSVLVRVGPHQFALQRLCLQVVHFSAFPQHIRDDESHVRLHSCYITTRSRRPAPVHAQTWHKVVNLPLLGDIDSELWNWALLLSDSLRLHRSFLCLKILNSARLKALLFPPPGVIKLLLDFLRLVPMVTRNSGLERAIWQFIGLKERTVRALPLICLKCNINICSCFFSSV